MLKKEFREYYLGLDIGTESLGWAVTDLNYKVQKLNGKALWGVRLFEGGKTAEERRIHRAARRRQQRKISRIKLLQELFAEEICKVDAGFFQRLSESKLHQEDKAIKQPNTLFFEKHFMDKDYYKNYPTIYHLRKALIEGEKEFDVRLVYLAIHHIIKNRGHFLFEGQSMENISSFQNVFNELKVYLKDEFNIELDCQSVQMAEEILKSKQIGIREKKKKLGNLFYGDTMQKQAIIGLIAGAVVNLKDLFDDKALDEAEITKVCFASGNYDQEKDQLSNILEDRMYCIDKLKAIYDWAILAEIRQGYTFISHAKTAVYDKHNKDLRLLKKVVKVNFPEKYKEIFSNCDGENNYCAYVGMSKKNKKKVVVTNRCSQEELCKFLENILKQIKSENTEYKYLMSELANRTLLPKQITKDNGVIPYQLHLEELNAILNNASKYLDFLNTIDETGFSVKEKIIKILEFRIPYYIGPLNNAHHEKGNCWIVKHSAEKIRPWNFENVVDIETSAERFIEKMTNKCTYLIGADVLPKNSLIYSEFMVLNELNNLKINGEEISVKVKQKIVSDLFMKTRKVTKKKLRSFLESEGVIERQDEISGIDGDFKASLTSYLDFKHILGDKIKHQEMIEEIIRWIVLFGNDKKLLRNRIEKIYKKELLEDEIKKILSLTYSGWGRLSREFLKDIVHVDKETGACSSIISALRNTNNNLMQLLSYRFDFAKAIEEYNAELTDQHKEITYELVERLYVSPAIKRSIWQTLTITKEITKIMQHPPKKIFIEMARGEAEKKPTKSRKSILLDLYKDCKDEERKWIDEIGAKTDSDLRSDRLYLYYTQMGRCMYTGDPIDPMQLFDVNIYDVDHIFPKSKVKDDSIENRVLVKRKVNAEKSDMYPLSREIQEKNRQFWASLMNRKLIGEKKYDRLTRTTPFEDHELADFIARQLVETRQSTKAVAELLKQVFDKTEIIYVKAGNVADFRQRYDLIKVRDINDYHHAKDAFLNVVVGNVFHTKFTHSPINFIKKNDGKKYNLNRIYDFDVIRNGFIAWKVGDNGTIGHIRKVMKKNNILFTRYVTEQKGCLFDQMIVKKGNGQLPIKSRDARLCDIQKYGGYNKIRGAYFMLVEHTQKRKRVRTLEFVPIYLAGQFEDKKHDKLKYCTEHLQLSDPRILLSKIKINTLFNVDGFLMHISGRTGNQLIFKGANQLCIGKQEEIYLKKVIKYLKRAKEAQNELMLTSYDGITKEKNLEIYDLFLGKLKNTVYSVRLSAQIKTFESGREKFIKLFEVEQCRLLGETLHLFQCNSMSADLRLIGGPKSAGLVKVSNAITNFKYVSMIHQSPSGVFTQEIDLLKL